MSNVMDRLTKLRAGQPKKEKGEEQKKPDVPHEIKSFMDSRGITMKNSRGEPI